MCALPPLRDVVGVVRLRFKLTVSINEAEDEQHGPDTEAQIGHLEHAGHVDTGMGFVPPGPKESEAWDD